MKRTPASGGKTGRPTVSSSPAVPLAEVLDEVRRITIQTRRLVSGVMTGGYLSVFRGVGLEFDAVREYVDGDDPRTVDWNVTARVGRPFVKTYMDERELTVLFLLDLSGSMEGGFGAWSVRQSAARVAACLGLSAAQNGDKVGLIAFSEGVSAYVAPRKGRRHAKRVVRDCLALQPDKSGTDLGQALEFAARGIRGRAIVFVLSDFLGDGWGQPLELCARRHDVIAVRLLAPELTLPRVGLLPAWDPESGRRQLIDTSNRRVREVYDTLVSAWKTRTERAIRRAHVDLMDVPVPRQPGTDHVVAPIRRFFRMRERRGAKR